MQAVISSKLVGISDNYFFVFFWLFDFFSIPLRIHEKI